MTDVIIPYRDTGNGRAEQLARLLERLPSILEPDSRVYIAEQVDSKLFNRGLMLNLGVRAAFADGRGNKLVLHDVDLLPSPEMRLLYARSFANPVHLAGQWIGRYDCDPNYSGGVLGLSGRSFIDANGFPNSYYGWGGEDEAFSWRLRKIGLKPRRPNADPTRFFYDDMEGLSLDEKLTRLRDQKEKCMKKWELKKSWAQTWTQDGFCEIELFASLGRVTTINMDHHASLVDYDHSKIIADIKNGQPEN